MVPSDLIHSLKPDFINLYHNSLTHKRSGLQPDYYSQPLINKQEYKLMLPLPLLYSEGGNKKAGGVNGKSQERGRPTQLAMPYGLPSRHCLVGLARKSERFEGRSPVI